MTSGAVLLPWAEALLLEWNAADPVSTKEIDRNEAIYAIQFNRNPFIDRPDFVQKVFQPELSPVPHQGFPTGLVMHQNIPNPFNPSTKLSFEMAADGNVRLKVYDAAGRLVATLVDEHRGAGSHEVTWDGRDDAGRMSSAGVYMYRLEAGNFIETKRMVLIK